MSEWLAILRIISYADLPERFQFEGHDCTSAQQGVDRMGHRKFRVTMRLDDESLQEAYFRTFELASELADRISFLTYAPAVAEILSVTVPQAFINEPFLIAVPIEPRHRTGVPLSAADIEGLDGRDDETASVALRCFRRGVTEYDPYHSYTELWTSLETLCSAEASAAEEFNQNECPECHHKWPNRSLPRSRPRMRSRYWAAAPANLSDREKKEKFEKAWQLRIKLVHGTKSRNRELRTSVEEQLPILQTAAAAAVADRLSLRAVAYQHSHVIAPYFALQLVPTALDKFEFQNGSLDFDAHVAISEIPQSHRRESPVNVTFNNGLFFPIPIEEDGYPPVAFRVPATPTGGDSASPEGSGSSPAHDPSGGTSAPADF